MLWVNLLADDLSFLATTSEFSVASDKSYLSLATVQPQFRPCCVWNAIGLSNRFMFTIGLYSGQSYVQCHIVETITWLHTNLYTSTFTVHIFCVRCTATAYIQRRLMWGTARNIVGFFFRAAFLQDLQDLSMIGHPSDQCHGATIKTVFDPGSWPTPWNRGRLYDHIMIYEAVPIFSASSWFLWPCTCACARLRINEKKKSQKKRSSQLTGTFPCPVTGIRTFFYCGPV